MVVIIERRDGDEQRRDRTILAAGTRDRARQNDRVRLPLDDGPDLGDVLEPLGAA